MAGILINPGKKNHFSVIALHHSSSLSQSITFKLIWLVECTYLVYFGCMFYTVGVCIYMVPFLSMLALNDEKSCIFYKKTKMKKKILACLKKVKSGR